MGMPAELCYTNLTGAARASGGLLEKQTEALPTYSVSVFFGMVFDLQAVFNCFKNVCF